MIEHPIMALLVGLVTEQTAGLMAARPERQRHQSDV
jgi:hypothetical protein